MLGVTLLSFFVWQHHLFVSGINADLRPFYMLSTELISLPTGFIFLCAMGTIWRGRIRFTVPMLFCLAWVFNFLFGGISGVFLSDVPSDVTTHGSFFSMAHFHYTIMGGLVFTFFAAIYYWGPKMTGFKFNERLAKIHFWSLFIAFNSTFAPLFALGFLGMPRRVVTYPTNLQGLNDWVSVSAFVIGLSMLVFLCNVVWSLVIKREPAEANPWHSKSAEWQLPTPVPVHDFDRIPVFDARPVSVRCRADRTTGGGAGRVGWLSRWKPPLRSPRHIEPEPPTGSRGRYGWPRACCAALSRSSSCRSCSRTSTCARSTRTTAGRSGRWIPTIGLGIAIVVAARAERRASPAGRDPAGRHVQAGVLARRAGAAGGHPPVRRSTRARLRGVQGGYASVFIGLDGDLRRVRDRVHLLDRDPGGELLARAARGGINRAVAEGVPADDAQLLQAGIEACSFFWAFYVAIGVGAFIVLYIV